MSQLKREQRRRLRAHFGFSKMPFHKGMRADQMFDSLSQRELTSSLMMWTEIHGIALIIGPSGVGKSISLRRFIKHLDTSRFSVIQFTYLPTTVTGFLRSLSRVLGLPMRLYGADLFDAAREHLACFQQNNGTHPLIIIDDAEGLCSEVLDALRRLTTSELDAEDLFSILISGTEEITLKLHRQNLESLRSRIVYAQTLKAFTFEDTSNYLHFHLERASVDPKLFSDDAARRIFHTSQGRPRYINQLALQALIAAAAQGIEEIDGRFMEQQIIAHPLYRSALEEP